jgi:c-di-GMP-binding flagellar brake protein YcgR
VSNYNEQFLKQNPLAVLGVLRDLKSQQVPLRISWSGGQFISKVLAVSPDELVMDFGSQEYENQAVQRASQISIIAETQGAKVEFTLPQLKKGEYQQLPAFISSLPPSLWFVQRREYFRIGAPLHPPYRCTAKMPDNSTLCFRLFDLSLGGMGGLLETAKPEGLVEGIRFAQVELNMEQWGCITLTPSLFPLANAKLSTVKTKPLPLPA